MTTTLLRCVLALSLLGIPAAVHGADATTAPIVLKIATVETPRSPLGRALAKLAAHLRDATKGEIEIKVMPSGILGDEAKLVRRAVDGELQAYGGSLDALAAVAPEVNVLLAPQAFRNERRADKALDGRVQRTLEPLLTAKGLHLLAWGPSAFRVWYSRKPLRRANDAKGMRVPAAAGPAHAALYSKLGMTPADPMPLSELLRNDAIDAVDETLLHAARSSLDRSFTHVTLTNHALASSVIVYSTRWLDGLPERVRKAVLEPPKHLARESREELRAMQPRVLERLRQLGVSVHTPTRAEARSFTRALRSAPRDIARELGGSALRLLRATR
jgi:TRAP-type C4-dicarboxylate transport system substrate-binding protein